MELLLLSHAVFHEVDDSVLFINAGGDAAAGYDSNVKVSVVDSNNLELGRLKKELCQKDMKIERLGMDYARAAIIFSF